MKSISQVFSSVMLIAITLAAMALYVVNLSIYVESKKGLIFEVFSYRKEQLLERLSLAYVYTNSTHVNLVVYNYGDVNVLITTIFLDNNDVPKENYTIVDVYGEDLGDTIPVSSRLAIISIEVGSPLAEDTHTVTLITGLGNVFTFTFGV
ncbi:hypothetical protein J4526_07525 [Desulfurococcaceae archaeon MEX13E-LK6-19]|nr:hypothetical protein J4526_07525 [Desulfurococcaceae archaeon MEX13E-LK6-19]